MKNKAQKDVKSPKGGKPGAKNKEREEVKVMRPPKPPTELRDIHNKEKRQETWLKRKAEKKKEKKEERLRRRKEAEKLGDKAPPKEQPKTLESTREFDETIVDPDDEEVLQDEATDQFADYFAGRQPKILVTTNKNPHGRAFQLIREFTKMIPNTHYYKRRDYNIKQIVEYCKHQNWTDIIIVHERKKNPDSMTFIHLPNGPTAYFKLSGVVYQKDIPDRVESSASRSEIILNNFNTRLGHSVGRMFAALLPHDPNFQGRQVITFHNQRDFIFVRFHKYLFENGQRVNLREIGPRFTLKLQWLQKGTFDTKHGEYEWHHKTHMDTSRRRFFL